MNLTNYRHKIEIPTLLYFYKIKMLSIVNYTLILFLLALLVIKKGQNLILNLIFQYCIKYIEERFDRERHYI